MQNLFPTLIPVIIGIAALVSILLIIRHVQARNKIKAVKIDDVRWDEYQCPRCKKPMTQGYSMSGKGIIWREKTEQPPGTFSTIGSALDNTMSFSLTPALNQSWHCKDCSLLLVDHSGLVKQ